MFISSKALAGVRDISRDSSKDNLLLEWQGAIKIARESENPKFIIPLLIGETRFIEGIGDVLVSV